MNRLLSIFSFVILISNIGFAQPGANDPTFNPSDIGFGNGDGADSPIDVTALQTDGKTIISGTFTSYNGTQVNGLARLNVDGTIDPTFNCGLGISGGSIVSIGIQSDGKIIIVGIFNAYNGTSVTNIVRLNIDGTLDSTFNGNTFNNAIRKVEVQTDDKLVLVGDFTLINGLTQNRITRLDPDGNQDLTFNSGTGANNVITACHIQDDGKIIIAGVFSNYNGVSRSKIARIHSDGSIDVSFYLASGLGTVGLYDVKSQSTGKVIIAGSTSFGLNNGYIARLNSDGTMDASFTTGSGFNEIVRVLAIQDDDAILVGGDFSTYNGVNAMRLARLQINGLIDNLYQTNVGSGIDFSTLSLSVQPDGKTIIGGVFGWYNGVSRNYIARIETDGSIDLTFNTGSGFSQIVESVLVQSNGKILVGGEFYTVNGIPKHAIVCLNNDGNIDNSSSYSGDEAISIIDIKSQPDDKIIISGGFDEYSNTPVNSNILRLNANGTIDQTFLNPGNGTNPYVMDVEIQSNGKIVLVGAFTVSNGNTHNRIARLNSDGSTDNTFSTGTGANSGIFSVDLDNNDKILIGGGFLNFNGTNINRFARLNTNGSLDNSFDVGSGADGEVVCCEVLPNGKILVGGAFLNFNGVNVNRIVLLNPDGSIDNTFMTGSGANGYVTCITVQANGKIILGGEFTVFNNVNCGHIVRLNPDGTIDYSFNTGSGFNNSVTSFAIQNDGKLIVGGNFTSYNNYGRNRLARLFLCQESFATETQTACASFTWPINGQTYSSSGQYIDTISNAAGCDSIITLDLTIIPSLPLTIENSFSMPSNANNCVGEAAVTVSGNAPFELDFDNGSQVITSSGYSLVTNLCAGVHDLHVTDNCGDTLTTQIVIPVDSNFVFNNPFIDSLAQDSLGVTLTNCDIYYGGIDTAYIDSIWATGNTVNVIWNVVDSNGSNFDTTSYVLNNGNGVYWLQLSVFCPNKSLGEYFTVTEAIYFNNGSVSTAGLADVGKDLFAIYPNPTNDQVHIYFSGSDAELTVYDVQGKVVLKDHIQNNGTISLQNFERGVYLFDFKNSQGQSVQRVVKQ